MNDFAAPISAQIWDMKYRLRSPEGAPVDRDVADTWRRVARALAAVEPEAARAERERQFFEALQGFRYLPAGRILSGAGTGRAVTLFNCFVMGTIPDSLSGIFEMLKEGALTMQQGGGIGFDFTTIRPKGAPVAGVGADASGPPQLHGRLGRHVPHHHVGRLAPGRDDGDAALRPPRHRGLHRRQAGPRAAPDVQPIGAGHRRLHGSGRGRRPLGAAVRGPHLPHHPGARPVEPDHAGDLRLRRAGCDLH